MHHAAYEKRYTIRTQTHGDSAHIYLSEQQQKECLSVIVNIHKLRITQCTRTFRFTNEYDSDKNPFNWPFIGTNDYLIPVRMISLLMMSSFYFCAWWKENKLASFWCCCCRWHRQDGGENCHGSHFVSVCTLLVCKCTCTSLDRRIAKCCQRRLYSIGMDNF